MLNPQQGYHKVSFEHAEREMFLANISCSRKLVTFEDLLILIPVSIMIFNFAKTTGFRTSDSQHRVIIVAASLLALPRVIPDDNFTLRNDVIAHELL